MSIISTALIMIVALEALYIMRMEMFGSEEKLHQAFGLRKEYLKCLKLGSQWLTKVFTMVLSVLVSYLPVLFSREMLNIWEV